MASDKYLPKVTPHPYPLAGVGHGGGTIRRGTDGAVVEMEAAGSKW